MRLIEKLVQCCQTGAQTLRQSANKRRVASTLKNSICHANIVYCAPLYC